MKKLIAVLSIVFNLVGVAYFSMIVHAARISTALISKTNKNIALAQDLESDPKIYNRLDLYKLSIKTSMEIENVNIAGTALMTQVSWMALLLAIYNSVYLLSLPFIRPQRIKGSDGRSDPGVPVQ